MHDFEKIETANHIVLVISQWNLLTLSDCLQPCKMDHIFNLVAFTLTFYKDFFQLANISHINWLGIYFDHCSALRMINGSMNGIDHFFIGIAVVINDYYFEVLVFPGNQVVEQFNHSVAADEAISSGDQESSAHSSLL